MAKKPEDVLVVMVTAANMEEATKISQGVVSARLAACATMIPAVNSMYWWEGKIVNDQESLIVLKTTQARYAELGKMIQTLHSYKVPEILALPVSEGVASYTQWVRGETARHQ